MVSTASENTTTTKAKAERILIIKWLTNNAADTDNVVINEPVGWVESPRRYAICR